MNYDLWEIVAEKWIEFLATMFVIYNIVTNSHPQFGDNRLITSVGYDYFTFDLFFHQEEPFFCYLLKKMNTDIAYNNYILQVYNTLATAFRAIGQSGNQNW